MEVVLDLERLDRGCFVLPPPPPPPSSSSSSSSSTAARYRLATSSSTTTTSSSRAAPRSAGGGGGGARRSPSKRASRSQRVSRRKRGGEELTCHTHIKAKRTVAGGCVSGQIIVWVPKYPFSSELRVHTLSGHGGQVHALGSYAHHSETLLVSASADRTVKLWDPWSMELDQPCVQTLAAHEGTVTCVVDAGELLLSGSTDGSLVVWAPQTERELLRYPWFTAVQRISLGKCWVNVICARQNESLAVYVGDSKGRIHEFQRDEATQAQAAKLYRKGSPQFAHEGGVVGLQAVARQNFLISVSFDTTVRIADLLQGAEVFVAENPNRCRYLSAQWEPKFHRLLLLDEMGHFQVWDVNGDRCVKNEPVLATPSRRPCDLTALRDGEVLMCSSRDVRTWKLVQRKLMREFPGHEDAVVGLTFILSDSSMEQGVKTLQLYSASLDNTIRCWDPYDMSCLSLLEERDSEISCLHYYEGTSYVLTGHQSGDVKMWNIDSGSCSQLQFHRNTITGLAVAPTSQYDCLLSVSFDGKLVVWELPHGHQQEPQLHKAVQLSQAELLCVTYSFETERVYAAGNDCVVYTFDAETLEEGGVFSGHREPITCLATDGNMLLSGSEDGTINVWDTHARLRVSTIQAHDEAVRDLLFIEEIGLLVSCAFDGSLALWDYVTGEQVLSFDSVLRLSSLAYKPDDRQLFVGTEEAAIALFPLPANLFEERTFELKQYDAFS